MRFSFEWQEAPGVKDPVLARTWASLSLHLGEVCLTKVEDRKAHSVRTSIHGSTFHLVDWLIQNWWFIFNENWPYSKLPEGRSQFGLGRCDRWLLRHNFLAASHGFSLPDLTLYRNGPTVKAIWHSDPDTLDERKPVRFLSAGQADLQIEHLEFTLEEFIQGTVLRLAELDDPEAQRLNQMWLNLLAARDEEFSLYSDFAAMGLDPDDEDEVSEELLETYATKLESLDPLLRADFVHSTTKQGFGDHLCWLEQALAKVRLDAGKPAKQLPSLKEEEPHFDRAYELGFYRAKQVRRLIGNFKSPIADVNDLAARLLRVDGIQEITQEKSRDRRLEALVVVDARKGPTLIGSEAHETMVRFRTARAIHQWLFSDALRHPRLLSTSGDWEQRVSRAFAAELLMPSEALRERVSVEVGEDDIEELAREFGASSRLVAHQVENHLDELESIC